MTGYEGKHRAKATGTERAPPNSTDLTGVRLAVEAAQVQDLFRAPIAMAVNLVNAPIVVAVVWHYYAKWQLFVWLAAFAVVIFLRALVWRAYIRSTPPPEAARIWARRYMIGTGVTGCLWGLAGSIVFVAPDPSAHAFIAFILAGMSAGAVASNSVYLASLFAFMIPALAPITIAFFIHASFLSISMGALGLVFGGALALIGRNFNESLSEGYRLQFENAVLIGKLTAARDVAEAASDAKSRFLAHMSHELRTPLNAIIGFSEMFSAEIFGKLPSENYINYSRYIHESAYHLLNLIKEILDFSKAEAEAMTLEEAAVDLAPLIATCHHMVGDLARAGGIELQQSLPDEMPRLWADAGKVRQILINFLTNAIKFTPSGGRVRTIIRIEPSGAVALIVEDTGIGMKAEDIPRALEPFVQLDESLSRKHGGVGLGLPLSKHLVELHGGTLEIMSAPGHGTVVTVRFPPERTIRASGESQTDAAAV